MSRLLAMVGVAGLAWIGWNRPACAEPAPAADPKLAADYATYLKSSKGILDIRTIHQAKLGANALDLAIVSAGFTAAEKDKFLRHSEDMKEAFFSYPPWSRYRDWVNFHTVFVADEGPATSRLKVEGYKGNILMCDNGVASEYGKCAADTVTTLVLHNSDFSTPTCGVWGVVTFNIRDTKHSGSSVHELGHGMGGLGDEYIQQSVPFTDPPESLRDTINVTAEPNPRLCKWHYWTAEEWPGPLGPMNYRGSSPIGNFEGAGWPKGIYRPEDACMMRGDRDGFCAVCDETMQASIFRYTKLFEKVEPSREDLLLWKGESINFRVAAISPLREPSAALRSRLDLWLDGINIATSDRGEVTFQLDAAKIKPGVHQLGAGLNIQCEAIRRDFGFLSDSRAWMVKVLPHEKPGVTVQPQVSVSPQGTVNVPVSIQHRNAALFTLRMEHAPENAVLESGRFKWRSDDRTGSWRVDFIASFEGRDVATESMAIKVVRTDGAGGSVEIQPQETLDAVVGKPMSARLKATAGGGGHLLFETVDSPEGAALDRDTGELSWVPVTEQAGPHRLRFRVRNGTAAGEGELVVRVSRPGKPSPVSYCNTYVPDTLASLKQWQESPLLYQRIFGTLRLLRDRYAKIHEPALAAAETMFGELTPPYQANVIEELSMQAWSFTDKPAILAWMRRIAAGGQTATQRELLKKLDLMASLEKIKKVETGSGREHLIATANSLVKASDPAIQSALGLAIKAICKRANAAAACQRDILSVLVKSSGPGRAALVPLLPLERTPELTKTFATLAKDSDKAVASAAQQIVDYFNGLATTADFITAWQVSGPYLAKAGGALFDETFGPEQSGGKVEWKSLKLEAAANGVYAADLARVFGGEQRVAYMKTTLRCAKEQEVQFSAGSDDAIKVWLNGELIHARNAQRPVNPTDDKFRGRLKPGDNTVLCKIVQYTQGWAACMSLRAADGGPALGVSVTNGPD
ncbi:MAG: M64 family metallo-endopeptidase [Verrucomicrobia bacterium]|nr:M64 family metallo-endopeptidase [Verrucomicrobiota bacterium]